MEALMDMRDYLSDQLPTHIGENGEIKSPFEFQILEGLCPKCHGLLVQTCGIKQCLHCPLIKDWLADSRRLLRAAKAQESTKYLKIVEWRGLYGDAQ